MHISILKTLAKFFRRISRTRQAQSLSLNDETWNHQRYAFIILREGSD
jgi:hypothetical protein